MQNYLQSKKKRIMFPFIFFTFMAICALFLYLKICSIQTSFIVAPAVNIHQNTKYISILNSGKSKTTSVQKDEVVTNDTKMNKIETKNSNIVSDSTKSGISNKAFFDEIMQNGISVYNASEKNIMNLPFEEYILGCVLSEMPSSFNSQALMAQAVAVRSFTLRKALTGDTSRHPGSVVCTDFNHCQSYISPDEFASRSDAAKQSLEKVRQAVNACRGIVAIYDGEPINAVYHAASGFNTLSSSDVWGGNVAYLKSVDASEDPTICSKQYTFSYKTLSEKLSLYSNEVIECFSQGSPSLTIETDENNCVRRILVSGSSFDKSEIKKILSLRSQDFSVLQTDSEICFTTYGYGHRVGMSQYGADALADKGYNFTDILKYYYSGIEFTHL